jgi:hypothetical protein
MIIIILQTQIKTIRRTACTTSMLCRTSPLCTRAPSQTDSVNNPIGRWCTTYVDFVGIALSRIRAPCRFSIERDRLLVLSDLEGYRPQQQPLAKQIYKRDQQDVQDASALQEAAYLDASGSGVRASARSIDAASPIRTGSSRRGQGRFRLHC